MINNFIRKYPILTFYVTAFSTILILLLLHHVAFGGTLFKVVECKSFLNASKEQQLLDSCMKQQTIKYKLKGWCELNPTQQSQQPCKTHAYYDKISLAQACFQYAHSNAIEKVCFDQRGNPTENTLSE